MDVFDCMQTSDTIFDLQTAHRPYFVIIPCNTVLILGIGRGGWVEQKLRF